MPLRRFDKMLLLRRAILILILGLPFSWVPAPAHAQLPPGENWRTLETEHFRVTYPEGLLDLAQRAGARAETAWSLLDERLPGTPSGRIDLVVTDHADISNGYTQVFPSNRIVIFAPPPVDGFGLPHMDEWMELVITHELVHVFHFDYAKNLGGALRRVFGRFPLEWPFFPGAATPGWTVEGIPTYFESALTNAGRVRGTFHEMVVRTAILEDRFESIDRSSGDSPAWPAGQRPYIYGSLFFQWLVDRHGEEALGAFVEAVAGQWIPYRPNSAATGAFGTSFSEAWGEWRAELEGRYSVLSTELAERAPITRGEALTTEGYYAWDPAVSPDGRWLAFTRLDGRSDAQIRLRDLESGQERKLARTNGLTNLAWTPAGEILFSQTEHVDSYRVRGDLFLADSEGNVRQVTKGARLDHPDVAPDGTRAVAVQEEGGTSRLVMVDLASGGVSPLTEYQPQELWSYPRWSPDGRWIAVSRWQAGAYFDVVLMNPSGEVGWEVTRDRAVDNGPVWSPDGEWLFWASDRSGISNLYAVPVDARSGEPGRVRQITNILGGASDPAIDPTGEWIYFSSYHADGWRVERIPYQEEGFSPLPLHPTFQGEVDPSRYEARVDAQEGPYRAHHTLLPTFWSPMYREGDHSQGVEVLKPGWGLLTQAQDLVGRHSYSLWGTVSSGAGSFSGAASYSFSGLENPLLGVAASQTYDADPRRLAGLTEQGDTVPLFLVERERSVGVGATILRTRSRSSASLNVSASHVWEDRLLLEEDLTESSRFNLSRPDTRLAEGRVSAGFGTARSFPFSISREDGVGLYIRGRARRELAVPDSIRGVEGADRSFRDLVGRLNLYKGFRGPGFGNHVLGLRAAGGVADGPGADRYHFEVGGASGTTLPIQFLDLGGGLLFPVRGYPTAERWGRYAWSASAEYRFPIAMVNRGSGLLPLHLDWISGALFLDGGNAWGPTSDVPARNNPRQDPLWSTGGELMVRVLPLFFQEMDFRLGVAFPLVEGEGTRVYLRLGSSF